MLEQCFIVSGRSVTALFEQKFIGYTVFCRKISSSTAAETSRTNETSKFQFRTLADIPKQPFFVENRSSVPPEIWNKFPSVKTVLSRSLDPASMQILQRWRKRQIAELGGEKEFNEHYAKIRSIGSSFHSRLVQFLRGIPIDQISINDDDVIQKLWNSVRPVLSSLSNVRAKEATVFHPTLGYKGKLDAIVDYKQELHLIDWKTISSAKPKITLDDCYDDPVQVAAYAGALNASNTFEFKIDKALLIYVYHEGEEANIVKMDSSDLKNYFNAFKLRLVDYYSSASTNSKSTQDDDGFM